MPMLRRSPLWSLLALLLLGCSDTRPFIRLDAPPPKPPPDGEVVATFYALGDWGEGNKGQKAVAHALRKDIKTLPPGREVPPFVLGLGDNVYDNGLPPEWGNPKTDSDTVGELKTGCKMGQESTILICPKALIRAFGGFANSIGTPFGHPSSSSGNGLFWG